MNSQGSMECAVGMQKGVSRLVWLRANIAHFYVSHLIAWLQRMMASREQFQKVKIGTAGRRNGRAVPVHCGSLGLIWAAFVRESLIVTGGYCCLILKEGAGQQKGHSVTVMSNCLISVRLYFRAVL